jgi:GrpB-like predicted nucleotidyltransferase (UPF0157 family)
MTAPVYIEPYAAAWASRFEVERELLRDVLAPWLAGPIEHVGSTAVVGLAAKPIVDIMAGVASLAGSRSAIAALAAHGYCHHSYAADVEHWFCKPSPELRTHHLHLVPVHSELWQQRLMFRDALRARPALAAEYARLKVELAEHHRFDREAYTQAKSAFISGVLREVAELGHAALRAD